MELDKTRIYHGYILEDPGERFAKEYIGHQLGTIHPCDLCDLNKHCAEIADTLNHIEYCLCSMVNKKYKEEHPNAHFVKIEDYEKHTTNR